MGVFQQLRSELGVAVRARRNRTDLLRWMVRRPAILGAIGGYETALLVSGRVELRVKLLAGLKTSSLIGCPF